MGLKELGWEEGDISIRGLEKGDENFEAGISGKIFLPMRCELKWFRERNT